MITVMKTSVLLSLMFFVPFVTAEECLQCAKMGYLEDKMKVTKADWGNRETLEAQDAILNAGTEIIDSVMKTSKLNLTTAKALLTFTAKLLPYDQPSLIVGDNYTKFMYHYSRCDKNVFKPALAQIVTEGKITEAERSRLLKDFRADAKPSICPR